MTDQIEILGARLSPFVERVYLQIQAKGLSEEVLFPGLDWEKLKTPEYLAISPFGKMPVLRWGDFSLYESTPIMEFLEDVFPEKPLLPEAPKPRARIRLLIRLLDLYYHPNTVALMGQVLSKDHDKKFIKHHIAGAIKPLNIIEAAFAGGEFLVGSSLTLADTTLFASLYLGQTFAPVFGQEMFDEQPKLQAWYEGKKQQPMFKDSIDTRGKQLADFMAGQMEKRKGG